MTFEFRQAALSYPEPVIIPSRLIKLRFLSASTAYTRHNRGLAKKGLKHHPGKFARLRRHPDNNANDVLVFMNAEAQKGTAPLLTSHHLAHVFDGVRFVDQFQPQIFAIMLAERSLSSTTGSHIPPALITIWMA